VLKQIFISMRPKQWVKNFAVFPAIVFSKHLFDPKYDFFAMTAFFIFCILAGAIYIFNDIQDYEKDRLHPDKRKRPIASGALSIDIAKKVVIYLSIIALGAATILAMIFEKVSWKFPVVCLAYLILQWAYSKRLKQVVILDVGCIATGFVFRVLAGGIVMSLPVSKWLIICTTLGALFLGFGKRRHEITLLAEEAADHRKILEEYSPYFLDQMIAVVTASTVVAYSLYTTDPETIHKLHTQYLPITIPFVIYAIFRYLYLVHQKEEGGSPSKLLLADKPLALSIILWFLTVVAILYF